MINYIKFFVLFILSATTLGAFAQTSATTTSPYSKYGIGLYQDPLLPQNRGFGGIGVGVGKTGGFNDINVVNPASYSTINLTTIDMGAYANSSTLSQTNSMPQTSSSFRLSHIAFAIPTGKHAAFSFGLLPYADMGYNYAQNVSVRFNNGASGGIDTNTVATYKYNGEGGLSKGYIGYGIGIGKNLHFGFNVSYIFGNEKNFRSTEFAQLPTAINSSVENSTSAGGVNYDYGLQYYINFDQDTHLILGYSGSAGTSLNSTSKFIISQYRLQADGTPNTASDSIRSEQTSGKIQLPMINRFGISYQKDSKYMIGADFKIGSWSDLTINGVNAGLQNNQSFAIGGQITPNINAINSYLSVVDYRLGFNYDKTYINANGTDIKQYGATIGLGIPIPNTSRTSFYKINFAAEIGKRGTLESNLVNETFFNFHLGFTINDKWFQKFRFD
jgi:hypothetical protein